MRALVWAWVLLIGVVSGAVVVSEVASGAPRTNAEMAASIAADFACPVCDGQSVAESDVPVAQAIRREIRQFVDDGRSTAEIRDYLVGRYGESIDLKPRASGVVGLVWMLPVVASVVAVAGLVAVFRRWRRTGDDVDVSDVDRDLVERYLVGHDGSPSVGTER